MSQSPQKNDISEAAVSTPEVPLAADAAVRQEEDHVEVITPPKMSRREEVAMQRAAKKKEEEDNLRFKPSLAPRKTVKKAGEEDSPTKPEEPAYNRLYSEARKKQEDAKNASPKPEFTFKPTVPHRQNSNIKARAKSPLETSNRLYQTAARQSRAEEPVGTFKPTISKRAKSLERNPGISTADRLYAQAILAKEKQEKMREQAKLQEAASLTFAPSTNESGKPKEKKAPPVSARMQLYIEQRNKKLEEARKEKEAREAAEFTGRPSIGNGKKKESKSETVSLTVNVFDRLAKAAAAHEPEKDPNTYQPTMFTSKRSQSASKAVRRSSDMGAPNAKPIHERLYSEAEQRRRELAAERDLARQEEEKQLTFTPQISSRPVDGTHEIPQADSSGTPMSVFKRLNSISKDEQIAKNEKRKEEKELENCTFKPEINAKSAGLFKAAEPVHVRLMKEAERQKELKKHFEDRKAEEELMECTFTPNLSSTENFNGRHSAEFGSSSSRQSGEFGRGPSFTFSEAGDETPVKSPPKVARAAKSPAAPSPAVRTAPVVTKATVKPAGLSPAPTVGLTPAPTPEVDLAVGLAPAPVAGFAPALVAGLSAASVGLKPLSGSVGLNLSPVPAAGLKALPVKAETAMEN